MKKQSGFTLIEILLVFSIVLLIASISSIFLRPQYLFYEKEKFFSQFKADFLYSQQYAISQQKNLIVYILPNENRYFVKEKYSSKYVIDRVIPKPVKIENGTGTIGSSTIYLELEADGNTNKFGTFYFSVGQKRYKITMLIGAGRFYVEQE